MFQPLFTVGLGAPGNTHRHRELAAPLMVFAAAMFVVSIPVPRHQDASAQPG